MDDLTAYAYETLAVSSGNIATSLTTTVFIPAGLPAKAAIIIVNTVGQISYTYGGVTVGSATGHVANPFDKIELFGQQQIRDFSTTSITSGTATEISVTYFR